MWIFQVETGMREGSDMAIEDVSEWEGGSGLTPSSGSTNVRTAY